MLVLGASEHAPGAIVACWPDPAQRSPRLSATLEIAHNRERAFVQEPRAGDARSYAATPVVVDSQTVGALAVAVRDVAVPELKALSNLLAWSVEDLGLLLAARRHGDRFESLVASAGGLLDFERLAEATHGFALALASELGCERVSIGLRRRRGMRVVAVSSSRSFASESDSVRSLGAAMEEAADQDAALEFPAPADALPYALVAHQALAESSGAEVVRTLPLAWQDRCVGAVVCEWSDARTATEARRERLRDCGLFCGPILGLAAKADEGVFARARARAVDFARRHFGADHPFAKTGLVAALTFLLVLLCLLPADYRVSARASLEGRVQRALVAAVEGYLFEAHAKAGDLVRGGDVLARLDDRDLRLEQRKHASEAAQLETEYREALAAQDRTRIGILRSQIEKASAQLELATEELGRTTVTAPFDGIIVEGNLDHALGSPVARGDLLFEIAPLDGYRIIVRVEDRDIADVAPGQSGQLALSALPDQLFPLLVERVTPIATTRDGSNYFRVEAVLEEPVASLRPGMEGIAKIDVGERRLVWIWTHELLDWLRLRTWSWLP